MAKKPETRSAVLHVRLTPTEQRGLRELARKEGLRLADLVRALLLHRIRVKTRDGRGSY